MYGCLIILLLKDHESHLKSLTRLKELRSLIKGMIYNDKLLLETKIINDEMILLETKIINAQNKRTIILDDLEESFFTNLFSDEFKQSNLFKHEIIQDVYKIYNKQ
jgi:hypothetical protein